MILIRLLLKQSDQGLHCFFSPICPNTLIFTVYDTLKFMHNILREKYFDIVSEGLENISSVLEFCSNWLRLITLCENITLFRSSGPNCKSITIWFKHIYFKSNIHGNYNSVIYINIIGSERKHYSLFGSSPKHYYFNFR